MSTVENIKLVTEDKNNLKEVVNKKTVVEHIDNNEPGIKKQRLSDSINDCIKNNLVGCECAPSRPVACFLTAILLWVT